MSERIETVQNIPAAELQAGGFAFQLDGATDEEQKAFNTLVEEAKAKNLNLVLNKGVKVIDLKAPVKPAETPAVVEQPKVEAKEEPKTEPVVTQAPNPPAVPETLVQPQQPAFVMPQNYFQPAQQQYVYNPFANAYGYQVPMPVVQQPVQPVQQPPIGYHVVMPQYITPAPTPQKTEEKKQ
jgi:hypothetical protein